jgi:hypothetical protein
MPTTIGPYSPNPENPAIPPSSFHKQAAGSPGDVSVDNQMNIDSPTGGLKMFEHENTTFCTPFCARAKAAFDDAEKCATHSASRQPRRAHGSLPTHRVCQC